MQWWRAAHTALAEIPHAVIGAVAANQHMPPRQTGDLDLAVRLTDLGPAEQAMATAGWVKSGLLTLAGGLKGSAWGDAGQHEVDLLGIPGRLGDEVVDTAQTNRIDGLPYARLPYLVVLKLLASRGRDIGDLTSMLGAANEEQLVEVRGVVRRLGPPEDTEDLEQLIVSGNLERQASPEL